MDFTPGRHGLFGAVEWVGICSCRIVAFIFGLFGSALKAVAKAAKKAAAPARNEIAAFWLTVVRKPLAAVVDTVENVDESRRRFDHRKKMFGAKKAVSMQWSESKLAMKRKGNPFVTAFNIVFPILCGLGLYVVVDTYIRTDYVVAVEYDGANLGIVSDENVIGSAQKLVSDMLGNYAAEEGYFINTSITIKPLSSNDRVLDYTELAQAMEERISVQFDRFDAEAAEAEAAAAEEAEIHGNKVKAYGIRVDGELIGAVKDYADIEKALDELKKPYNDPDYVDVFFDKDVEYDIEEYVDPSIITSPRKIVDTLTGYISTPDYYEVVAGDNMWKIADSLGMTVAELGQCYATYNGKVIEDMEHSVLRVGTLIQLQAETPYLQVEYQKEMAYRKTLPYETITIEDGTLPAGKTSVEVEGSDGEQRGKVLVTYLGETAVRKKIVDAVITVEPVSEIIRVGTGESVAKSQPTFSTFKGNGEYCWPVNGGYISAYQGDGRGHKGIDIAAPLGTAIYAAANGTVIDAGTGWNGGYGNALLIQNDDGNLTRYAHQSELVAQMGDYVEKGQLIGYVGSTGDSSGNHLHFEVILDGQYIDPVTYVGDVKKP